MVFLLAGGCSAVPPVKPAPVRTDPEQVIGSLQWEISEGATDKILGKGQKQILLQDVQFTVASLTLKKVSLDQHFFLGMAESPSKNLAEKKGFGLTIGRDDLEKVFSWEWFVVNYEDHAYKLQENGSLRIKMAQVGPGWEVTRTEFLSDVSLRAMIAEEGGPDNPKWRVRILKGSFIRWPSLLDGRAVANE
jgi:hypothetical protein